MNFGKLNILDKLKIFSSGTSVVSYVDTLLGDIKTSQDHNFDDRPLHPVSLILLDINMTIMTGMEALKSIK